MKVIIAGGRDFNDIEKLRIAYEQFERDHGKVTECVCGMANGADMLGFRFFNKLNIKISKVPADWNKYGKRAGYVRNKEMSEYGDALIAFWDGLSRGTSMMIELARHEGLVVEIVRY